MAPRSSKRLKAKPVIEPPSPIVDEEENRGANRRNRASGKAAGKAAKMVEDEPEASPVRQGGKRKLYNPKKAARPAFLVTINDIPH